MTWPEIPYGPWRETCSALHLYCQIVGKYRFARTPWLNHSWQATLYPDAFGLTTGPIPDGPIATEIMFNFVEHRVQGRAADGRASSIALGPMSVAQFHARFVELVRSLGGDPRFDDRANELPDPVPFTRDEAPRPYDAAAVTR